MKWEDIKKIDSHIHIIPDDKAKEHLKYESEDWSKATLDNYLPYKEKYNIEKAVIVPINEGGTYFNDSRETNKYLSKLINKYPDKCICFADVLNHGGYFATDMPKVIEEAYNLGLKGLKIHPSNLGIAIDSLEMVPLFRKACDLNMPIMIHSYPYAGQDYDLCAPHRIHRMARIFPDARIIISHMGGVRWMDALEGWEYVDISTFLPELVRIQGLEGTKRILHEFGADRLIFATDYPQVYKVKTENIYKEYFNILDKMEFSEEDMEKIAYRNMEKILQI